MCLVVGAYLDCRGAVKLIVVVRSRRVFVPGLGVAAVTGDAKERGASVTNDTAVAGGSGQVTLSQKLAGIPRKEAVEALDCHESWISKLVNLRSRPSRELLDRAKEAWPEIDVQASEEEYLSPVELSSRRGRALARLVLALPEDAAADPVGASIQIGAGFLWRLRATALAVLEAGRG